MLLKIKKLCLLVLILILNVVWCGEEPEEFWEEKFNRDDGYGVNWMYFPDGDEMPRKISLKLPISALRKANLEDEDIEYRFYSRENKDEYILLDAMANPMKETNISLCDKLSMYPIKLITHGWMSSADKNAVINIKNAYLESGNVNVIGVDWSSIANSIMYPVVAIRTKSVGAQVGEFLDALHEKYQVSGKQIHLIGHSLGAHVMGIAGHRSSVTVDRITGLDPARPLFEWPTGAEDENKLDPSDADFVDVIHTCGGALGVEGTIGHADFFPNSGVAPQPGCFSIKEIMEACSHSRSHFYFSESISYPKGFPACDDYSEYLQNKCNQHKLSYMGEGVNRIALGKFYLDTNEQNPYGRGGK